MGQAITVVSGKGGTGKTAFTANVGMALAQMGYATLCLDCDIGLRNLDIAMAMTDRAVMDFTDVLAGRCTLEEAAVSHPSQRNLHLLTAPARIDGVDIDRGSFQKMVLAIRERFDYCLMDAPAGLGDGFRLAVCAADRAAVITTTEASSLRDAQRTAMELAELPRLERDGTAISATAVRALVKEGRWEEVRPLVPPPVYDWFASGENRARFLARAAEVSG